MSFNIGDKVRCIDIFDIPIEANYLTKGKIYTIIKIESPLYHIIYVKNDIGNAYGYYASRFEKLKQYKEIDTAALDFIN